MANSSLHKFMVGDVVVTLILSADHDPETVADLDVEVGYPNGSRYSATMLTIEAVDRLMRKYEDTGESLGGRYFQSRDLVILRRGGVPEILEVITRLIEDDEIRFAFQALEFEDD
jgi:hypothetical protein